MVAPKCVKKKIQIHLMNSNRIKLKLVTSLVKTRYISIFPKRSNIQYICVVHFLQTDEYNEVYLNLHSVQSLESIAHGITPTHYLLSFVGRVFFSSVLVFFSFEVSNLVTSDKSGLSDILTVNIVRTWNAKSSD